MCLIWIFKRLYFWTDIWISFLLILFFFSFFFLLPGFYWSNEMKYRNMFSAIASCVNLTSCFIVLFTFPKLQVSRISLSWISIQNWDFLRDSYCWVENPENPIKFHEMEQSANYLIQTVKSIPGNCSEKSNLNSFLRIFFVEKPSVTTQLKERILRNYLLNFWEINYWWKQSCR